jgi:hypothetical protein
VRFGAVASAQGGRVRIQKQLCQFTQLAAQLRQLGIGALDPERLKKAREGLKLGFRGFGSAFRHAPTVRSVLSSAKAGALAFLQSFRLSRCARAGARCPA